MEDGGNRSSHASASILDFSYPSSSFERNDCSDGTAEQDNLDE